MVNGATPPEVEIDESLVRGLLRVQCPAVADLPLAPFNNGWDNDIWALGDELLVRLPRREVAAELVLNEQRVLPRLAHRLTLPVPVQLHDGMPQGAYPWHWSVVPRFPGARAAESTLRSQEVEALRLARFLRALHEPATDDAPENVFRGGPLSSRTETFLGLKDLIPCTELGYDILRMEHVWSRAESGPQWTEPSVWLHGDLHAANVLVDDGRISAIIDWGDVCSGDPACDLAVAWMLFDAEAREVFFREYGDASPGLRARAGAWALLFGLIYWRASDGDPLMAIMSRAVLDRIVPVGRASDDL